MLNYFKAILLAFDRTENQEPSRTHSKPDVITETSSVIRDFSRVKKQVLRVDFKTNNS